jgi:cytidine deaminase
LVFFIFALNIHGMTEKLITAKILFCTMDDLSGEEKMLVEKAKEMTKMAYAPYSSFYVGAAVLLDNGQIIGGNNQENAAYPSGLCAERVALFYANANWPGMAVKALAVAARKNGRYCQNPVPPCGSCRQVLMESEVRQRQSLRIIMYGEQEVAIIDSAQDLLPFSFDDQRLK